MLAESLKLINRITGNVDAVTNYLLLMCDINKDDEQYVAEAQEHIKLLSLITATSKDVAEVLFNNAAE